MTQLAGNSNSASAAAVAAVSTTTAVSTSGRSNGSHNKPVIVLVIGNPEAPELQALKQKVPAGAVLLGIGGLPARMQSSRWSQQRYSSSYDNISTGTYHQLLHLGGKEHRSR